PAESGQLRSRLLRSAVAAMRDPAGFATLEALCAARPPPLTVDAVRYQVALLLAAKHGTGTLAAGSDDVEPVPDASRLDGTSSAGVGGRPSTARGTQPQRRAHPARYRNAGSHV